MNSDNINTPEQRVALLRTVINAPTNFSDAEFELFNANGFDKNAEPRGIPAPSTWTYEFVVKVTNTDVFNWTEGLEQTAVTKLPAWAQKLMDKRKQHWSTEGEGVCYASQSPGRETSVFVYPEAGIVFKRVIQN